MRVIFVGLSPSTKSLNPDVPFYDTKSGITLKRWIDLLGLTKDHCAFTNCNPIVGATKADMVHLSNQIELLEHCFGNETVFVALGTVASKALTKLGVLHISMPHPSPRNRKLNDPNYIINILSATSTALNLH